MLYPCPLLFVLKYFILINLLNDPFNFDVSQKVNITKFTQFFIYFYCTHRLKFIIFAYLLQKFPNSVESEPNKLFYKETTMFGNENC